MSKKKTTTKGKAASAAKSDPDIVQLSQAMKPKAGGKKTKAPAKTKPAKEAKPRKLSCLDAASQVLQAEGKLMNTKAMNPVLGMRSRSGALVALSIITISLAFGRSNMCHCSGGTSS